MHVLTHLLTAIVLVTAGVLIGARLEWAVHLAGFRKPLVSAGLIFFLLAVLHARPAVAAWSVRLCFVVLGLVLALLAVELTGRGIGLDFRSQRALLERTPPNWRLPRVPLAPVYFRREGGVEWTGQVMRTYLRSIGLVAEAYADEPVITLRYDEHGFRNEPRPSAWEIAVAGDSFTELGDVPYERLFTTILARNLGCRVLNLGVGGTGAFTQLSYLEHFGISPRTRDVMVVFFEGNDLWDIVVERAAAVRFSETGERPWRRLKPQTSFLRALGERWSRSGPKGGPVEPRIDGWFAGPGGETAITLGYPPPGRAGLLAAQVEALDEFFRQYARFTAARGVRPWLVYMPGKERVLHGHIRWAPDAEPFLRQWEPNDLPQVVAEHCARYRVRFVDLTPDLIRHVREVRELVFNHLHDCHLNARGSEVVAATLTHALRDADEPLAAADEGR
ncbi:MAG: hypothetical protein H7A47_05280 [Verrucomicrobiales bacterium]|nr:hypothetical protein [Verrucomicrobiales bacterium]